MENNSPKFYKLSIYYKFTLLEILVAMTIISICFIVMLNALGINIKNTSIAEGYTTACFLAKTKIVEVFQSDSFEEGTEYGDFGDDYSDFEWEEDVKILEYYNDNRDFSFDDYDVEDETSDKSEEKDEPEEQKKLFQVNLKISFKAGNQIRSVNFETVVYAADKDDLEEKDNTVQKKSKKVLNVDLLILKRIVV